MNYIGIDVHFNSLNFVHIDDNLRIIDFGGGNIDKILGYVKSHLPSIIAIDAPLGLNKGLMNDEEYRSGLASQIRGHYNKKVSEYELSRRGINPFPTPDNLEKIRSRNDLKWMETGLRLVEGLMMMDYSPLNQENLKEKKDKGLLEVFPHACFCVMAGYILPNKKAEEGLEARLEILASLGFSQIGDYLNGLRKKDRDDFLDSLAAAHTAFRVYNGQCTFVGDAGEGQIALPAVELRDSYKRKNLRKKV